MNLNLTGRHMDITPAIREHVIGKLDKVKRHFDNVIDVNVILSVEKLQQKAEATLNISGKTLFAESEDSNLYVAIDALIDSLDRQVLKHKEKFEARRHDDSGKHQAAE
ncbi:MAG: ribosome-associated translation inhibitor RaiA [Gammaproteobacteria bacterium]|nr:ribosome-associated translation inhibitor RaiA [Gammaproteobacteria bacterium]MBU1624862.1 ribosome-associated translation inhibitor RaiA [Gammaproteobacteria bacterium]MBU1982706.1 ribosome-associated translation inhibitor RaiA [Gammaproteobacteria bacterium]